MRRTVNWRVGYSKSFGDPNEKNPPCSFQDAPALALQMGHSGTAMLFAHYREVVTPGDAERTGDFFVLDASLNRLFRCAQ